MEDLLTDADRNKITQYVLDMKSQIIANLKNGKTDKLQKAVEDALKKEMLLCAAEFFETEIKADMLKQFTSQKEVLLEVGAQAINGIGESLKDAMVKMVAERMANSWDAAKVIKSLFGIT